MARKLIGLAISFLILDFFTLCSPTDDKYSLLEIKSNINNVSNILNNWSENSNTSICSWIGIYCDTNNRRVTALNLSGMGLAGTVSPAIGNLSVLKSLDISYNSFSGSVPEELSHLQNLQHLILYNNSFTGTIPASFGNFTKLKTLNLRSNQFTGSVPGEIFNISSLRVIHLSANKFYGSLPVDICNNVSKIEEMYLSFNQFEGRIPSSLFKCRELQYLSLEFNKFIGGIPKEIGNLTKLRHLFLGSNNLEGTIPAEIGKLQLLEQLKIQNSSLNGHIPDSVFNMSYLEMIILDRNNLSGEIPSSLWECRRLRNISMSYNHLAGSISSNIRNLTSLKYIRLGFNNLTGTIPREIGNLKIEYMYLTGNAIEDVIPLEIFNISTMIDLSLTDNSLRGPLPLSMGLYLPSLQRITLDGNPFTGQIPISISNSSKLTLIQLSRNSFSGSVPNTLGNLRDLQRLYIGQNNLTGLSFFDSLSNCKNLEVLSIPLNQFNAILPDSLTNFSTSLRIFQAFGSYIRGEIPARIGNLTRLTELALDSNDLTGIIPPTLGRLTNLEQIYLEYNELTGSIPDDLCQLERLGDFYVSHNKLVGSIPSCLGQVRSLRGLFLDSNFLTSTIPLTLWSIEELIYLNLSTNSLTGDIPSDIQNLRMITQLDLSWNLFSGDIPSTIGSNQMLTFLSLAHNKLEESIPQSLGNLISLVTLDLSNNNLSGLIPKSLAALRYLEYFNASYNRLEGEIPTGGHFDNFTAQSFMQNSGLCGEPRLNIHPCKKRNLTVSRSRNIYLLKYILPIIISMILLVALAYIHINRRKRRTELKRQVGSGSPTHAWRRISYHELYRATNGFSESNLIGAGGIASVYKGKLPDEVNIAVKVFNLQSEQALKTFEVECEVLRTIRHRNLTKIISSCSNPDFLALVLEHMPNGSLEKWLYSHNYCLSMLERLNILIDVASALEYLHHGLTTPVLHWDLKPSNVLIDEDMMGHVCDFGISKLLAEDEFMAQTKTLATIGYMAPEYGREGIVSTHGDVYSYGILLMETFTRKKPADEMFSDTMSIRKWIDEASMVTSSVEVIDANMIEIQDENFSAKEECASSILHLALDCSVQSPTERISMQDVVFRLNKIRLTFLAKTAS